MMGCEERPTVLTNLNYYDMTKVFMRENRSYMPLNIAGNPNEHAHAIEILNALEAFEEEYPNKKIVYWVIEKQQGAHYTSPYIFGIWIDHQPKE